MPKRWKCLLAGPPEAGKSTLCAALLEPGSERRVIKTQSPVFHKDLMVDLPGEYITYPQRRTAFLVAAEDHPVRAVRHGGARPCPSGAAANRAEPPHRRDHQQNRPSRRGHPACRAGAGAHGPAGAVLHGVGIPARNAGAAAPLAWRERSRPVRRNRERRLSWRKPCKEGLLERLSKGSGLDGRQRGGIFLPRGEKKLAIPAW